jgi:hypothetical protein
MKTTEVPQDDKNMLEGKFRDPIYVVDENGNYTTKHSLGWEPKNIVMQQAWDDIHERVNELYKKVLAGKISPIPYYMEKQVMNTAILAGFMKISRWRVRRHFKPKVFAKLKPDILERYAKTFDITLEELTGSK